MANTRFLCMLALLGCLFAGGSAFWLFPLGDENVVKQIPVEQAQRMRDMLKRDGVQVEDVNRAKRYVRVANEEAPYWMTQADSESVSNKEIETWFHAVWFHDADANMDGKLSKSEFDIAMGMEKSKFDQKVYSTDTNGDGIVSKAEYDSIDGDQFLRHPIKGLKLDIKDMKGFDSSKLLPLYDLNKDGQVTVTEMKTAYDGDLAEAKHDLDLKFANGPISQKEFLSDADKETSKEIAERT